MKQQLTRRRFLMAGGAVGLATVAYGAVRGVRFPQLSFEPAELANRFKQENLNITGQQFIRTQRANHNSLHFRAIAPEPGLVLQATESMSVELHVGNLAVDAELQTRSTQTSSNQSSSNKVREQHDGINRLLNIDIQRGERIDLNWKLPALDSYTFASIGDSGGHHELAWCIQRAHQLGARFLLHLGDFNYQAGDYDRSVNLFNQAPLPCYVSIGNHDFHDEGLIYQPFLDEIGPFNNYFAIGKTRFANIDTAASFLPYSSGQRGKLFKAMRDDTSNYRQTVAFTHRPLVDPAGESDHDIGSIGERDWLIGALKSVGADNLLSGHIHIFNRERFQGIDNIIVGQGLGHQDILSNHDISKMAIGQVDSDGSVSYRFANLAMPMTLHCHPRSNVVKQSMRESNLHLDLLDQIDQACLPRS